MPEEYSNVPYTNREIREKWHDISNDLQEIKNQTTRTNGRVTTIERWQYMFMGGMGVLTVIVVPLLAWALFVLSNIQDNVHRSVDEALSAYDLSLK